MRDVHRVELCHHGHEHSLLCLSLPSKPLAQVAEPLVCALRDSAELVIHPLLGFRVLLGLRGERSLLCRTLCSKRCLVCGALLRHSCLHLSTISSPRSSLDSKGFPHRALKLQPKSLLQLRQLLLVSSGLGSHVPHVRGRHNCL
jgi:hypothetical protein